MELEHLQDLLKLMCNFNNSLITHSFSSEAQEGVTIKCLTGTYILEVAYLQKNRINYYTSIDGAAMDIKEELKFYQID